MAKILITGSAAGLGSAAALLLAADGHDVVLHARNEERAAHAMRMVPAASTVLVADISTLAGCLKLGGLASRLAPFDSVIHNAAVFHLEKQPVTADGYAPTFAVNTLAPYVLTALIPRPARLIYLGSDMHASGDPTLNDLGWTGREWDGAQAYSDSKLHDTMLALAVARLWPMVLSNAVDPGWVRTKMGGSSAPDSIELGSRTQAWLAASNDGAALASGTLFHRKQPRQPFALAREPSLQDALLERLADMTGIRLAA